MTIPRSRRVGGQLSPKRRIGGALLLALAGLSIGPAVALAHPLGNFTINHYAGIRVGSDRIALDVVIDRAEIPAFQERQRLDVDRDGTVSAAETGAESPVACAALAADLQLSVGEIPATLAGTAAGLSFPAGAGGLVTMRLVCEYVATIGRPIAAGTEIAFEDRSFAERIGWREIVDETATRESGGVSKRLTTYPEDLLARPLAMQSAMFRAAPATGADAWVAPDAEPLGGSIVGSASVAPAGLPGAVPGGVGSELAAIIDAGGLDAGVLLASLLVAVGLGAAHALSPGHGKTIMAAYLVGSRGSARQAIGLGLAVTVSHTLGVLVLALITLAAAGTLPPERLYPILGLGSGGLVVAIGGTLLWRRLRALRPGGGASAHAHGHGYGPGHDQAHSHDHGHDQAHGHDHGHGVATHQPATGPRAESTLSWRSLFALGLSGGLVPSASALILLLGSIAAGRVAYGLVLVVAFGVGMAIVLAGIGFALVRASSVVERVRGFGRLERGRAWLELGTAAVVVVLGVVLTGQALTQVL